MRPTLSEILGRARADGEKRELTFNRETVKENERTVELAFSSEAVRVRRWYGWEVLSHQKGAVDLSRLNDGANLLINHDPGDWVGVIEAGTARIDGDKVARARARFGNSPRATEIFRDVSDGILTKISVGYSIEDMKLTRAGGDELDEFTVTAWTPNELSLVTKPADSTVGVGRAAEANVNPADTAYLKARKTMEQKDQMAVDQQAAEAKRKQDQEQLAQREAEEKERAAQRNQQTSAADLEAARRRAILNFAAGNKIADNVRDAWINQGYSLEEVSKDILAILEDRGRQNPQPLSKVGLSSGETQRFSFSRAILACVEKDWSKAGFELECSRAVAQRLNRIAEPTKFYVPFEVMQRPVLRQQRDLTVATAGAGGFLVETSNLGFTEMLYNRSVAYRMGARRLSGLVGSVAVPRQSAAATAVWLANEASTITESQQTFVQMALSPKNVGAYTEISRQLLLQSSPGAEGIVTDDLAQVVATAADLAVLNGSGASGQPLGIIGTAGIGAVTGTSIAYAGILEFQTDVAASNVRPVQGGYVTTPAVAALLMQRSRFTNTDTPLWVGNIWDGQVSGFPAMSSNQMPAANALFGDWQEVVVGEWGVLEVEVNPFANFQAGIIGVRAIYSLDVGVRRPFAFSLATSIT